MYIIAKYSLSVSVDHRCWWFSSYLLVQKENYWSLSFRGLLLVLTPLTRSLNFLDVIADTITGNTMKGHYQTSQSVFFRPSFLNYNLMSINVCSNIFNFISFKLHKIVDAKIANWNMDFKLGILPVILDFAAKTCGRFFSKIITILACNSWIFVSSFFVVYSRQSSHRRKIDVDPPRESLFDILKFWYFLRIFFFIFVKKMIRKLPRLDSKNNYKWIKIFLSKNI